MKFYHYGITPEDWDNLYKKQGGRCAICGIHQSELKRKLYIDHCHKTNVVRGLLCNNCNRALGELQESPELLRKAADYLEDKS